MRTPSKWGVLVPELTVSDFHASLEFYTELLGFKVLFSRFEDGRFAYLEFGEVQLMLEEFHPDGWNTAKLERPYGRGINLQIECEDTDEIAARLYGARYQLYRETYEVWRETGDVISGSREFLVQDPDGYLLRFVQPLGEEIF